MTEMEYMGMFCIPHSAFYGHVSVTLDHAQTASEVESFLFELMLARSAVANEEGTHRNKIFYRHNRRLNSKLIAETANHRRSEMSVVRDKNVIWLLENQVNGLIAQNGQMSKDPQDIQEKNRQLEESYHESIYKLIVKDSCSRADMAKHQFQQARRGRNRLRNQFNNMRSFYNDSIKTYKMSATSCKEELDQVKAALEEPKIVARDTRKNLQDELGTLKQAYTECQDRLHVALTRVRSTAKDPSELEEIEERPEYIATLISKEEHSKALLENEDMKTINDGLLEEIHSLREQQQAIKIEKLQRHVSILKKCKKKLEVSLLNTTYQLRYLIRDVQNRKEVLPPERRNQTLLDLAARRRHSLKTQIIELDQLKRSNHRLEEQLLKEKQSYDGKVESLTRQIETLEAAINEATDERDTLRKVIEDHLSEMECDMKRERTEASKEIKSIRPRVAESEEVDKEAQFEHEQSKARATQLGEEADHLTMDLQSGK
ncbi:hypothetical protein BX666DRAFT_2027187 [Dichotomocladium elegans]|nr:hypothetical protein BX666DRAFT_2027187 [Dichotomocladium elegans]